MPTGILTEPRCKWHTANIGNGEAINIMATALACLSLALALRAATTEPKPKNAPWFKLVIKRAPH